MPPVVLPSPSSLCPVCCSVTWAGQNYTQISCLLPLCPVSLLQEQGHPQVPVQKNYSLYEQRKDHWTLFSHCISQMWPLGLKLLLFHANFLYCSGWLLPTFLNPIVHTMQFTSVSLSCSLTGCNFLVSEMRDLDKIYNKINLQTKSSVDTKHLKHKIIIVLIIQGVVGLENFPYCHPHPPQPPLPRSHHFLTASELPYLKAIRSLIWES